MARFISPPPTTVDGFDRFIDWTHREQAAGRYACFAVVPDGEPTPRWASSRCASSTAAHGAAEWGFVMGSAYWGTGLFAGRRRMVVDFAIDGWACTASKPARRANGRGNGALAKLGAVREAVLRQSFERHGPWHDQALWGILRDDWPSASRRLDAVVH